MSIPVDRMRYKQYYDVQKDDHDQYLLSLSDRQVSLGKKAWELYRDLSQKTFRKDLKSSVPNEGFLTRLRDSGLVYDVADIPQQIDGLRFHDENFEPILTAWLYKAFSHPFWQVMINGEGSARLFAGWLFELYHYTKNANRHMPLAAAECSDKVVKTLFAKHYHEEWNHYHFFARALSAMGYDRKAIENSKPLPMTMEMSNFMRQAARRDSLAYAICSAVLEGTTVDRQSFNPFYEAVVTHYDIPRAAVQPIYDHLDLDLKYQHSNLFRDICAANGNLSAERASLVLSYGHQMVEHIWMWTDNIWNYYKNSDNPVPHQYFNIYKD